VVRPAPHGAVGGREPLQRVQSVPRCFEIPHNVEAGALNVETISAFDAPAYTGGKVPEDLLPLLVSPEWVEEFKAPRLSSKRFPNSCQPVLCGLRVHRCGHGNSAVPPLLDCGSASVEVNVVRPARVIMRCPSGGRSTLSSPQRRPVWPRSVERLGVVARLSGSACCGSWPRCAPGPWPGHDQGRCSGL
jgi:hypothetical protein